jgi:hypothetical protein
MVFWHEWVSIDNDDNNSYYVYILILMHSTSVEPTMNVNVHNQCSDFDLMHGRHFSTGVEWNRELDEKVYAGNMMSVDLMPLLSTFEGTITYELGKKDVESTYIRLFVTWKSESYKELRVFVRLIEYEAWYDWCKVKLEEYCQ